MEYVLGGPERHALHAFLGPRTLVALDYDGTLAPIAPRPELARMADSTRVLLGRAARRFPVVILTGRSRIDALRFLGGIPVIEVIGSHGAELAGAAATRFARAVAQWREALDRRLPRLSGLQLEDKRCSLAVHYRHADDPAAAEALIRAAAAELPGARIVGGKKVVNIVPQDAPDKGAALLAACRRLNCDRAVFVGDDDTDESVFEVAAPGSIFTIRVGRSATSSASHYLRSQDEIDALLEVLLDADAARGSVAH